MLSPRLQLLHDSLQKLLRRGAHKHVKRILLRSRPADVAVVMRFLSEGQTRQIFDSMPDDEHRAEILTELDEHLLLAIIEDRPLPELVGLIALMDADDQADLLAELPESLRQQLIDGMRPADAEEIEDLLHYGADTAGGIMSPDFFALSEELSAAEAIEALQSSSDVEMAFYIYVINEHGHLVGVVSLRQLVVHPPQTTLAQLMATDVISAEVGTDQEEVAQQAARYNLLAIPVVDDTNRLVGIVTIDDVIDVIREEATEDILRMAGADESAFEGYSVMKNVRTRAPWLFATWLGGLVASILIGVFEDQLESQVALAAFIPIVLGMGGNVGSQTATIIVRGLATGQVSGKVGWRYFIRESGIGLMLGLLYGVLLGVYALVTHDGGSVVGLAVTVGVSILASMTMAASVGACTPLIFEQLNIDPAVATGPIVTTTVDILGILVYFVVASMLVTT